MIVLLTEDPKAEVGNVGNINCTVVEEKAGSALGPWDCRVVEVTLGEVISQKMSEY